MVCFSLHHPALMSVSPRLGGTGALLELPCRRGPLGGTPSPPPTLPGSQRGTQRTPGGLRSLGGMHMLNSQDRTCSGLEEAVTCALESDLPGKENSATHQLCNQGLPETLFPHLQNGAPNRIPPISLYFQAALSEVSCVDWYIGGPRNHTTRYPWPVHPLTSLTFW